MADKSRWLYYLRDDGLLFREFNGTIQYWCLEAWHESHSCEETDLKGGRFHWLSKAEADKVREL